MDDVWPSFVEYPAKKVEVQVADEPGDQRASGFTRFSALLFHPLSGETLLSGGWAVGRTIGPMDIRWRSRRYIMSERPLDVSAFEIEGDRDGVQESCVRLPIHSTTRHGRCIQFTGRSARLHSQIQSKHEMIGSIHIYQQMDRQSSPYMIFSLKLRLRGRVPGRVKFQT